MEKKIEPLTTTLTPNVTVPWTPNYASTLFFSLWTEWAAGLSGNGQCVVFKDFRTFIPRESANETCNNTHWLSARQDLFVLGTLHPLFLSLHESQTCS